MTVIETATSRARKNHRCDGCGGIILPGTPYYRQRGVFDGGPYVFKAHFLCERAEAIARRELELLHDEVTDPAEVRAVVLRFFTYLSSALFISYHL